MPDERRTHSGIVIIGGGPAGLMAAEVARAAGVEVDLYDRMGSVGRKILIAGKGGLNLTHSEPLDGFVHRFGDRATEVGTWLADFGPAQVCEWARGLGVETFTGSSGRVFPTDLRAAPLLRGWVRRLREQGVRFHTNQRWIGWYDGALQFEGADGRSNVTAPAVVLALGGGSWPQLGSDGAWPPLLRDRGIAVEPLQPSNCGFTVPWSPLFAERHAGTPLKPVVATWCDAEGNERALQGELMVTASGIEGSLAYALSAPLRAQLDRQGHADLMLDLAPGRSLERLLAEVGGPRGRRSIGEHLRRRAGLDPVKSALVFEVLGPRERSDVALLARTIKRLPLRLTGMRPLAEAISSAGGVRLEELDARLMMRRLPGLFCAGEMLDWDAPTGGYLLTACLASGHVAGRGAAAWLDTRGR